MPESGMIDSAGTSNAAVLDTPQGIPNGTNMLPDQYTTVNMPRGVSYEVAIAELEAAGFETRYRKPGQLDIKPGEAGLTQSDLNDAVSNVREAAQRAKNAGIANSQQKADHVKAEITVAPHDPKSPGESNLTRAEAEKKVQGWLDNIPQDSPERMAVEAAVANPDLKIVVVDGKNLNKYRTRDGNQQHTATETYGVSLRNDQVIMVAAESPAPHMTFAEEAGHNIIKNTYSNDHARPWTGDKKNSSDPRQALFEDAMRSDQENSDMRKVEFTKQLREDLGMQTYPEDKLHAQVFA